MLYKGFVLLVGCCFLFGCSCEKFLSTSTSWLGAVVFGWFGVFGWWFVGFGGCFGVFFV